MRGAESQKILGRKLGEMHKAAAPPGQAFGFDVPTFCGETEQDNRACDTWEEFWRERRIRDLIDRIGDPQLSKIGQRVCDEVVPRLLGKLDVRPSILHGDLWAGNAKQSMTSDEPIIFDSSAYYGHNEAESVSACSRTLYATACTTLTRIQPRDHPHVRWLHETVLRCLPRSHAQVGACGRVRAAHDPVRPLSRLSPLLTATRTDLAANTSYEVYHHLNHTYMFGVSRAAACVLNCSLTSAIKCRRAHTSLARWACSSSSWTGTTRRLDVFGAARDETTERSALVLVRQAQFTGDTVPHSWRGESQLATTVAAQSRRTATSSRHVCLAQNSSTFCKTWLCERARPTSLASRRMLEH